jgi:hypothetical protein
MMRFAPKMPEKVRDDRLPLSLKGQRSRLLRTAARDVHVFHGKVR